jgi:GNAT superfamily N-acetyltransferase
MPQREFKTMNPPKLNFHPLTPDRWPDLEALFGARGACGGCWCMAWRLSRSDFNKKKGAANKRALKKLAGEKIAPGVLAYVGKEPAGWCAIAPRESYPVLGNSRILAPVDDRPVWSVSCFFVAKPFRRQGMSAELLRAAVKYAKKNGAKIVEGYPNDLGKGVLPDVFVWTGLLPAFRNAGFKEVVRRSAKRPIVRTWS